jgi:predicted RNA-binding protein with PIN domain
MSRDKGVDDVDLLLIDGDNLLHAVRGSRDQGGVAWLLPRLSSWRPLHLRIVIGLDGHAAPGEASRTRATRGIEFHHSGRRSADDMLIDLLEAQPYDARSRTVVVTRDRSLQARAAKAGGASRSVEWLMRLVAGGPRKPVSGPKPKLVGIGQGKPPPRRHFDPPDPDEGDRPSWEPGRGATSKKGNPKRSPKGSRQR